MSRNKVITADAAAGLVLAGILATTGFVGAGFPEDPLKSRQGRRVLFTGDISSANSHVDVAPGAREFRSATDRRREQRHDVGP